MNSSWIPSFKESGKHSYHRRAISHDYYAPFIYHIILKKSIACESFGIVAGDARIAPGNSGSAYIRESAIGKIIAKALLRLPYDYPIIKLLQFQVMPDHVHFLLQILFRSGKHLDFYIDSLRKRIAAFYSKMQRKEISDEEIFSAGYCDKPLYENRSLDNLFRYIQENPHRLAMRRQFPQFFQRARKLKIGEKEYEAYGNLFLFRNPDKATVKISRRFTSLERAQKRNLWLSQAQEGSILVSPFISPDEKRIREEAEAIGGKIILITHEAFPERFKPSSHDFSLCCDGRLLIISLGYHQGIPLSRSLCVKMNELAKAIAEL